MRNQILLALLLITATASGATSYTLTPPHEAADVIVVFVPSEHHALNVVSPNERSIKGQILRVEKGRPEHGRFVHLAHSFTSALEPGVPVMLYLKKDVKRNIYYVIGIGPAQ